MLPHITATHFKVRLADLAALPTSDAVGLTALALFTCSGLLSAMTSRPAQITVDEESGVSAVADFAVDGALRHTANGLWYCSGRPLGRPATGRGRDNLSCCCRINDSVAGAAASAFTVSIFRSQSQLDGSGAFLALSDAQRLLRLIPARPRRRAVVQPV